MKNSIAILLATHNSEKFLRAQLDSLLNQTHKDFSIIISDDFSSDNTVAIINEYMNACPNLSLIKSDGPLKSAQANFWFLLKNAPQCDFYMFCDHDDVWEKNKIELTLNKMLEADQSSPALVHSDLLVVDGSLNTVNASMFSMQKLPKEQKLGGALIQNNVTGCTVIINSQLRELALKKQNTENMLMHDWYLSVLCLATGKVLFVDEALIRYRQHGNNEVGAKDAGKLSYIFKKACSFKENKKSIKNAYLQAQDIALIFKDDLKESYEIINAFGENAQKCKVKRVASAFKYGFWKNTFLRKLGQIIFM